MAENQPKQESVPATASTVVTVTEAENQVKIIFLFIFALRKRRDLAEKNNAHAKIRDELILP